MKASPEIIGIGAAFLDHMVRVSDLFVAGLGGIKGSMQAVDKCTFDDLLSKAGTPLATLAGGSAANTLKGLAALKHPCALLGVIGSDANAEIFKSSLSHEGVYSLLQTLEGPTGQVLCLITPDGERTFRDFLGVSTHMGKLVLNPAVFRGVKHVHVEGYTILYGDCIQPAMQAAKAAGAQISFNIATQDLAKSHKSETFILLNDYVDIVFANAQECLELTGLPPKEGCVFLQTFCTIAVITEGVDGCWVGSKNGLKHCPAFPVHPLDSTGAGDYFAAGFLHGILNGKSLEESAHAGALLAAEVVQVYGARLPKKPLPQELDLG